MYISILSITTGNSTAIITLSLCRTHLVINTFEHCCSLLGYAIMYLRIIYLSLKTGNSVTKITLSLRSTNLIICALLFVISCDELKFT